MFSISDTPIKSLKSRAEILHTSKDAPSSPRSIPNSIKKYTAQIKKFQPLV